MTGKKRKQQLPYFIFPSESFKLMREAVEQFARALDQRASWAEEDQRAKIAFARITTQQVKRKLDAMNTSVGGTYLTTFDFNEKIVLATAIQLYALDPGKESGA